MRVLLVEDNRPLADWLAKALRQSRFVVDCIPTAPTPTMSVHPGLRRGAAGRVAAAHGRLGGVALAARARQPRAGAAAHRPRRRGRPRARPDLGADDYLSNLRAGRTEARACAR